MESAFDTDLNRLLQQVYGEGAAGIISRAPGRVNLIGEHTDYNDGFVFPMTIPFIIEVAVRKRSDRRVRIFSADFNQQTEISFDEPLRQKQDCRWANYPLGVIWALSEAGLAMQGMEMVLRGNVPQGAGLSSSAALEVATAVAIRHIMGYTISDSDIARLCQKAENGFVGMNCGIMDQFIAMMGKKDHGLFLDCRSLEYRHVPLRLDEYRIVICQSGVKHALVDSEYNKRRRECEEGVRRLQTHRPEISTLRDATLNDLQICRERMNPVVYRRCLHVITENQRVLQSVEALEVGDWSRFGRLMNASHDSLRDDYEVSCVEIDLLVKLARGQSGVLGSRITGGGFGGCTVNLVAKDDVEDFTTKIGLAYREQTGILPRFYISTAVDGACIVKGG